MNNNHISRRSLLKSGAAAGAFATIPMVVQAATEAGFRHENKLAIPPLDPGRVEAGTRVYDLNMQDGISTFFPGYKTPSKGINGAYLGPVLRMRKGDNIRLNVTNSLQHDTTLHWHGFNLPAAADGGPHQVIRPGATWSPEFEVRENASTMWFHSHLMGQTAAQVWAGLAGIAIIDDDEADALDIPSEYGVDDFPLALQDRRFRLSGAMSYEPSRHDLMAGMQGNYPVLNGTVFPYMEVTTQRVRLRLLNGANASIYNLTFRDRRTFQVIGSDGGLLPAPVSLKELRLAPGERAEIIVDFSDGQPAHLESISGGGHGSNMGGGMMMNEMGEQSPAFNLLEMRPAGTLAATPAIPQTLASLDTPDEGLAVNTRKFLLEMPMMGMGMMMGRGGGFTINGNEMDMSRIDNVVKRGETEIWEITNAGPMAHPFHVHNTQFRVLDKGGQPPAPQEAGLKDTVLVEPGQTARILIRFDHYSDPDLPYMYHCHILEHEDAGMMGQFTVV